MEAKPDVKPAVETVLVKLRAADQNMISFKVKKTTRIAKVKETYGNQKGVDPRSLRLAFDGDRLEDDMTVEDAGLEEGDIVDVNIEQTGGAML